MSCCKEHKNDNCEDKNSCNKNEEDQTSEEKKEIKGNSTVPAEKLELLGKIIQVISMLFLIVVTLIGKDQELKNLLANKHLRDLLSVIDSAENGEKIMQKAMQEPIFVEFADACLRVVDPKSDDEN